MFIASGMLQLKVHYEHVALVRPIAFNLRGRAATYISSLESLSRTTRPTAEMTKCISTESLYEQLGSTRADAQDPIALHHLAKRFIRCHARGDSKTLGSGQYTNPHGDPDVRSLRQNSEGSGSMTTRSQARFHNAAHRCQIKSRRQRRRDRVS